jgi:hypothetical protein
MPDQDSIPEGRTVYRTRPDVMMPASTAMEVLKRPPGPSAVPSRAMKTAKNTIDSTTTIASAMGNQLGIR